MITLKHIAILLLLLAGISYAGEQQAKETKFPASYDQGILEKIRKSSEGQFISPSRVVIELDSNLAARFPNPAPYVWLQLKLKGDHSVKDAQVGYCSAPGIGLEQLVLDSIRHREFKPHNEHENWPWLWLKVVLRRHGTTNPQDSTESADPDSSDEFVGIDTLPQMIFEQPPTYSADAFRDRLPGTTWIKALIDSTGHVKNAVVGRSSGIPALDTAAVAAAYGCLFNPAWQRGHPVALWVTYQVKFKLDR
jgi:TonB family protein